MATDLNSKDVCSLEGVSGVKIPLTKEKLQAHINPSIENESLAKTALLTKQEISVQKVSITAKNSSCSYC